MSNYCCKKCESTFETDLYYTNNGVLGCRFCETNGQEPDIVDLDAEPVDYIEYLKPIIEDVKDGSTEPLTSDDVDFIMKVCRAKIEYHEGLISKEEYLTIINDTTL